MSLAYDPWATSMDAAKANQLAASKVQLDIINGNLTSIYLIEFNNWRLSVDAGKIDNKNPPQPPNAFVLTMAPSGFVYPEPGNQPVCPMPPIPEDRSKPAAQTNSTGNGDVQNVPPGDHYPVGFRITAPDGSVWEKQSSVTPFGPAYYYARVGSAAHEAALRAAVAVWGS